MYSTTPAAAALMTSDQNVHSLSLLPFTAVETELNDSGDRKVAQVLPRPLRCTVALNPAPITAKSPFELSIYLCSFCDVCFLFIVFL